jgi:proteasome accessory factor C
MADDANVRLRRLLHLLPRIADGEEHRIAGIAAELGVSREALLADLEAVSERLDEPGGYIESVRIVFDDEHISAVTHPFRRPMRLTVAELCALELGLAMLRHERPAAEQAAIDRAITRLRRVIGKLPRGGIPDGLRHASYGDLGPPEHLAAVRRALAARKKLRIVYHGSGVERSSRTIRPYSLAAANGTMYVVAYCERSAGMRLFRLDRMETVELTAAGFDVPADFSLSRVMREGRLFITERPPARMTVRYSARIARWIAEREDRQPASDGTLTVEYPLADRAWAVRHVLQYGPDAEVLEPADVREEIRRRLAEMSRGSKSGARGRTRTRAAHR